MDGNMSYGPDIRVTGPAHLKGSRKYHGSNYVVRRTHLFFLVPASVEPLPLLRLILSRRSPAMRCIDPSHHLPGNLTRHLFVRH